MASRTQPKPALNGATAGRAHGTSTTNQACQGSNHPTSDAAAAAPAVGGNLPGAVAPPAAAVANTTALHIAPLDLSAKPAGAKQPSQASSGKAEPSREPSPSLLPLYFLTAPATLPPHRSCLSLPPDTQLP